MAVQQFQVGSVIFGEQVAQKQGSFGFSFTPAPYSFNETSTKFNPRFLNNNSIGAYWGATGYYASWPCFGAVQSGQLMYQVGGFTINASGIFDVNYLSKNPFGRQNPNSGHTIASCAPGITGLWSCTGGGVELDKANFPTLSFTPLEGPTLVQRLLCFTGVGSIDIKGPILIVDELLREISGNYYLYNSSGRGIGPTQSTWPIASSIDFGSLNGYASNISPVVVQKGTPRCIDLIARPSDSYTSVKVHPGTGQYLLGGFNSTGQGAGQLCGTVLGRWDGETAFPGLRNFLTLSDASDDAMFQESPNIIQASGGGFFAFGSTNPGIGFFFNPHCTQYWVVNFNSPGGYDFSHETITIDYNGIWWYLRYSSVNTFGQLYWSGPGPIDILFPQYPLPMLGNVCMPSSNQPWLG